MARHKEFDPDVALARASELFRARGYDGASTNALVQAMGIGRGSLYETFGTKHDLFRAALRRYRGRAFGGMIADLDASDSPLDTIRQLFESIGKRHATGDSMGCLMVNSTVQMVPHDEEMTEYIRESWKRLEQAFVRALSRARDDDLLASSKDPRAIARFLLTIMRGMGVGTRLGTTRAMTGDIVSVAMSVLD